MSTNNTLTLLAGASVKLATIHTTLVPEVVNFDQEAPVVLQNDQHEYVGTAEVTDVKIITFALLQQRDLDGTNHPETQSWQNALHVLVTQVPEFSQLDKVSLVTFYVHAVSDAGLQISQAPEVAEALEVVEDAIEEAFEEPSEDEQYAALDKVSEIEVDDNEGNQ